MKVAIIALLIFITSFSNGYSVEQAEEVPRLVYEAKSTDWYKNQAELWKKQVDSDPKDSNAWYNYYKAYRYSNFSNLGDKSVQKHLIKILDDMEKYVPDSFEYLLMRSSKIPFGDDRRLDMLLRAYRLKPNNPQTFYDLLVIYDFKDDKEKEDEFYRKLYATNDIASGLLEYNYNVLMSLKKNAILFTNGDNDTYPARLLQSVFNIRPDVTVLNLSLSRGIPDYLERKLNRMDMDINLEDLPEKQSKDFIQKFSSTVSGKYPDRPIYFALTVYEPVFSKFKSDLYIIGLAYRYSSERIDNIAEIKRNFKRNLRLDYLQYDWYEENYPATKGVKRLNNNYVAPLLVLLEHYYNSGDREEAAFLLNKIKKIASAGEMDIDFNKYFSEKGIDIN